jgi:hypothetical protein
VSDLAFETRFLVDLQNDWPYRDLASVYHLGGDDAKHMAVESYRAWNSFSEVGAQPLWCWARSTGPA